MTGEGAMIGGRKDKQNFRQIGLRCRAPMPDLTSRRGLHDRVAAGRHVGSHGDVIDSMREYAIGFELEKWSLIL